MNEYEDAWNEIINDDFKDNNPIFKDVLRELTKKLRGAGWRCLKELLIEKGVIKESRLHEIEVSVREQQETGEYITRNLTEIDVINKDELIRALKYIVIPTITDKAIREGFASTATGNQYKEYIDKLRVMLPPEKDNKTYCTFDNDQLTDKPNNYSFELTDDNIIGVNEGVISCRGDGTCIILMQNKEEATDRKYYKVEVKGGKLYDASQNPPKLVSTDQPDEGGQNFDGTFTIGGVEFRMIHVEGGTFTMGATPEMEKAWEDESPTHKVTLSSYYIGETPVTQELWQAVMGNNPSDFEGKMNPMEHVSWNECQDFIVNLNGQLMAKLQQIGKRFRLPTEAEWEYAARGGNMSGKHKYSGSNYIEEVAWYSGNSGNRTHPVKGKRANELGCYDMSGNVWEWCQDWWGDYSGDSQTNPRGPEEGTHRVGRGGGWNERAMYCRLSDRYDLLPTYADNTIGLRLALSE